MAGVRKRIRGDGTLVRCVSILVQARTKQKIQYYLLAEKIAYKISKAGYGVITGGGLALWKR
jgi:predicted Rossmann-fold nucleotide-binding protein